MLMHHQFANQELARLDYAEAIRNSARHQHVVSEIKDEVSSSRSLIDRVRAALADAFAHSPEPRPTT
jgi:hypothetical protein